MEAGGLCPSLLEETQWWEQWGLRQAPVCPVPLLSPASESPCSHLTAGSKPYVSRCWSAWHSWWSPSSCWCCLFCRPQRPVTLIMPLHEESSAHASNVAKPKYSEPRLPSPAPWKHTRARSRPQEPGPLQPGSAREAGCAVSAPEAVAPAAPSGWASWPVLCTPHPAQRAGTPRSPSVPGLQATAPHPSAEVESPARPQVQSALGRVRLHAHRDPEAVLKGAH